MNSRERVAAALDHREPDRVPVDFGGSLGTGMHVSIVYQLRQAFGLDKPGTPVKVAEPYQMLGEIELDLMDALGLDVVCLTGSRNFFGFKNEDWKEWQTFQGTPVLVPGCFNTVPEPSGDIFMYPEGDRSAPPSGHMPKNGWYFDTVVRQPPLDESSLRVEDNLEEFTPISDEELQHYGREAERLVTETGRAVLAHFPGTAFGDIALVPAPWMKYPKGIRDLQEWYISTVARREFVLEVFERQCEIAVANLKKIYEAVGDRVTAVWLTGTDFGMQTGSFISPKTYRELYQPFHKRINDWLHRNTSWKAFIHSCGSVINLIDDFIEAGFDILNPVQCSAAGMNAKMLKENYGDRLVFWGGGVDTQRTLPFGTPDDVRREIRERIEIFRKGGGFVFNAIHNIQAQTPIKNVLAMFETLKECEGR